MLSAAELQNTARSKELKVAHVKLEGLQAQLESKVEEINVTQVNTEPL